MQITPRILYVDDDLANCEMMSYLLRDQNGYDVATAVDGSGAIKLIDSEFFDFYLLDYCLPDLTAIELCKHIRDIYPDAPITIYSALDRDIDRDHAFAAGADHYLVKPDEFDKVKPHIDSILGKNHRSDQNRPNSSRRKAVPETVTQSTPIRSRRRNSGIV